VNEFTRRLRGKVRQSRSESYRVINQSVNLTTQYIVQYHEIRDNYLARKQVEKFDLLILSTRNDLSLAIANAENMLALYPVQIQAVHIITQGPFEKMAFHSRISLINENDYLDNRAVVQACLQFGERSNWVKQQYLKMKFVSESQLPVLILDADTFFKKDFFLFSTELQVLLFSQEDFHYPYTTHCRNFFGTQQPLLNFVNHLQLQIPSYYREIFGFDFDSGWVRWANLGRRFGEDSPISEFQTYAGVVLANPKHRPILVSLQHQTLNAEDLTIAEFKNALSSYEGDLLTVGNKLLIKD
jgi:hypothetical protein